ncbi:hypothetical protein HUW51_16940 [Adhaeribacter swui]|uniref:Uncharacterized protein n=1 Tax=Adhaeribacter swui TaxID=2086471 RepID=A0A7G7GAZ1_9BACT|nr:hypothetical protein [Adhaeribacter swui]QNF34325.1 hypothetical protein HUW51_16940 [Adhaeribacter swui]
MTHFIPLTNLVPLIAITGVGIIGNIKEQKIYNAHLQAQNAQVREQI